MTHSSSNHCLLAAIGLSLTATACQDAPGAAVEQPAAVELVVDLGAGKAPGAARFKDLASASALVVSIEDASGAVVYDAEHIELYDFDGTYLSHPLSLLPGSHALTELLVVDAAGSVLYATPVEGADLAYLVAEPLAISFDISNDTVTTVRPEVLSTEAHVPEDFGYASFEPDVVDVLDFLVGVFVYDDTAGALVPSTANIEVTNEGGTVLYTGSLDASTSQVRVPAGHATYRVRITKAGYAEHAQDFTEAALAAYFDSATGGPLEVVLHGATVLSAVEEQAAIATSGAHDWEHFQIGDDHYLAVANYHNDSTHNISSKIYRWDSTAFVEAQTIPTSGARDWEHFQIGTDHYLAVANYLNDSTYNIDSKIYRWNGTALVEIQSIATSGAFDWEHFQIGSDHYLAVANYHNIASKLYRWDGAAFVETQSIATSGAKDWKHFLIGSDHYLAVANFHNGSTHNIASKLYRWDGAAFVEAQSFATSGAHDWEHFQIGSDHYLAMANFHNDSTHNIASKLYRWDGAAFVEAQSFATNGAGAWEHFQIGSDHYLAVTNHHNDTTYNSTSKLYRWDGTDFVEVQSIATNGALNWEYFQIGSDHYLALANNHNGSTYNIASKIYRLVFE